MWPEPSPKSCPQPCRHHQHPPTGRHQDTTDQDTANTLYQHGYGWDTTKAPPRHHADRDTIERAQRHADTFQTTPGDYQDITETTWRHHQNTRLPRKFSVLIAINHQDTTETPPRHHWHTTKAPPKNTPRDHRHRDTTKAPRDRPRPGATRRPQAIAGELRAVDRSKMPTLRKFDITMQYGLLRILYYKFYHVLPII